jgi:hypothetical protein
MMFAIYHRMGMGLEDGEEPERLWSLANSVFPSTVRMRLANRHDSLCARFETMARQQVMNALHFILRRIRRAVKGIEKGAPLHSYEATVEYVKNSRAAFWDAALQVITFDCAHNGKEWRQY